MMRRRRTELGWGGRAGRIGLALLVLILVIGLPGGLAMRWGWPEVLQSWEDQLKIYWIREWRSSERYRFLDVRDDLRQVDVDALIKVRTPDQVAATRQALIHTVFGVDDLPVSVRPTRIDRNIADPAFAGMVGIAAMDAYTVDLPYGLVSRALHLKPEQPRGRLVLYHEGHTGKFQRNARLIGRLVAAGYDVVAFSMLLLDNQPVVDTPHFGPVPLNAYDKLELLPRHMRLFFLPILAGMGQAMDELKLAEVDMVGFSGGGWATTLMAAMDPRIRRSFPVAGSYPMFLRFPRGFGAPHEHWGPLYRVADYLDLYVLGSYGPGRSQTQILNQFDSCCFSGRGADLYARPVAAAVAALGEGTFRLLIDDSHADHRVSDLALTEILLHLAAP